MHEQFLISAISLPQTMVFRKHRMLPFAGLRHMKLLISLLVALSLLFPAFLTAQTRDDSLQYQAPIESYIVKELCSSQVLMAKDIDRPVSPASLTKILTCIMAIESGKLDQDVVITKESTMVEPSKAGFRAGDRIKLIDLVKAAMVNSSNDAAFAIAIHLSGSVDGFVAAMNARAKVLGMRNSRFTNPAGFDKGIYAGNTSTAGDLLCLTEHAVRNPVFNGIARLDRAVFTEQSSHRLYSLKTHNKLLDKYPYAVGIKTGYTTRAGRCLIGRAIKDNRDILLVMLNARADRWSVAANMFDRALLINRGEPVLIAQTSASRVRQSVVVEKVRIHGSLKHGRRSANSSHAIAALDKKSKRHVVAVTTSSRKSKHQALPVAKSGRRVEKRTLVVSKPVRRPDRKELAAAKTGRKMRKRDLALSKPVKKNKKRSELSFQSEQFDNTRFSDLQGSASRQC
jgi:serine-type D-Ala-D-Ala carboxypeptidase (penicillin-binding protein 5/6)